MVRLRVTFNDLSFEVDLKRRVSYLRGDTGIGKTTLVRFLQMSVENNFISVDTNKEVVILNNTSSNNEVFTRKNCLFISDDSIIMESSKWFTTGIIPALVKNDSYILIINRAEVEDERLKFSVYVEFAIASIYVLKSEGKKYWCDLEVNESNGFKVLDKESDWEFFLQKCDCIITEDTYGMCSLAKNYFSVDVITSGGKDKFLNKVREVADSGRYKNILLCVDTSVYGQKFNLLKATAIYSDAEFFLDVDYECFEYILLVSNLLKGRFKLSEEEANTFTSWEKYFEKKLVDLTSKEYYRYLHGRKLIFYNYYERVRRFRQFWY